MERPHPALRSPLTLSSCAWRDLLLTTVGSISTVENLFKGSRVEAATLVLLSNIRCPGELLEKPSVHPKGQDSVSKSYQELWFTFPPGCCVTDT
ncbi:hypothetical protein GN956_G9352 [Arapaima gigas]